MSLFVSDSIGVVSTAGLIPDTPKAILALAHGAGAGMDHDFMSSLAAELFQVGFGTLRYNFPYLERRKKRPDVPIVAHQTVKAALEFAHRLLPDVPLIAAGKSFGGRMTSQLIAKESTSAVGLIFFGFPLHPANEPDDQRAEHLMQISIPMLFLQGSKDALAYPKLISNVASQLNRATLQIIEGADHSFRKGKSYDAPLLARLTADWFHYHFK